MKRKIGELFNKYKERRKKANKLVKNYLKGALIWDSSKDKTVSSHEVLAGSKNNDKTMEGFFNKIEI